MIDDLRSERRTFLKAGALAGALLTAGSADARARGTGRITPGDAAILRFLAAAEIIETDLWLQYAELGGTQDKQLPGLPTGGSAAYTAALNNLDADMSQYIHDNTHDELSHELFINAYLEAHGAEAVNLDEFRTLPSSKATGARQIGRLTNLMQLTVDTSWWTRYRSARHNPDLEEGFVFPQAVPALAQGQFPAIPRSDADLAPQSHIQAIANTAAFHFGFIEQGGSSLYPKLAQRVSSVEVLRILLSIGGTEIAHFQTWHDKAGNAVQPNLAPLTDITTPQLKFPNLNDATQFSAEEFQTNLIMPEPCRFLDPRFPPVSIIRPTNTEDAARGAVESLMQDGLFIGQSPEFFKRLARLAEEADEARREV